MKSIHLKLDIFQYQRVIHLVIFIKTDIQIENLGSSYWFIIKKYIPYYKHVISKKKTVFNFLNDTHGKKFDIEFDQYLIYYNNKIILCG